MRTPTVSAMIGDTPAGARLHAAATIARFHSDRRGRRELEEALGVQEGLEQGGHGDEQDVRKHPARQPDRQLELPGSRLEAVREERDDRFREEDAQGHEADDDADEEDEHPARVDALLAGTLPLDLLRHRDERRRQAALPHDRAERVRDAQGRVEGVGRGGRAEKPGDRRVAQDARHAGDDRPRGDAPGRPDQFPRVSQTGGIVGSGRSEDGHGWIREQGDPHRPPRGRPGNARHHGRRAHRAAAHRDDRDVERPRQRTEAGEDRVAHGHRVRQAREHLRALPVEGAPRLHRGRAPDAHVGRQGDAARSATPPRSRRAT